MSRWRELKYWIADHLFEYELDEEFELGIKEGQNRTASTIRVKMDYKKKLAQETGLTKTQALGWDRCMEGVENAIS